MYRVDYPSGEVAVIVLPLKISKHDGCRIAAWQAADIPTRMAAAAAEIEVRDRHPVGAEPRDRSEREDLLKGQIAVKDVPAGNVEACLDVRRH